MPCNGRFTINNKLYNKVHCVGFEISFNLDNEYSTQLRDVPCGISRCILDTIEFECFNETLRNRDQGNGTGCEGNLNFELIQKLVVTVKKKILYTYSIYIILSAPPVAMLQFFFINYILIIQNIDYLQLKVICL